VEFICGTVGDEIAGTMRIVYAPNHSKMVFGLFPTIDAHEKLRFLPGKLDECMAMDPRQCIDIAAMTVKEAFRNALTSNTLITTLFREMRSTEIIRFAFAAIDTPFYSKLKSRGIPFKSLGSSTMYWGSLTTAGILDFNQIPCNLLHFIKS